LSPYIYTSEGIPIIVWISEGNLTEMCTNQKHLQGRFRAVYVAYRKALIPMNYGTFTMETYWGLFLRLPPTSQIRASPVLWSKWCLVSGVGAHVWRTRSMVATVRATPNCTAIARRSTEALICQRQRSGGVSARVHKASIHTARYTQAWFEFEFIKGR
jgi:hypothetical protein